MNCFVLEGGQYNKNLHIRYGENSEVHTACFLVQFLKLVTLMLTEGIKPRGRGNHTGCFSLAVRNTDGSGRCSEGL